MSLPTSAHPWARATEEDIENMFVSPSEIARATGWAPNYVNGNMQKYRKRGLMLAGRPAYLREDMLDVVRQLEEARNKHPLAPSVLDNVPGQGR